MRKSSIYIFLWKISALTACQNEMGNPNLETGKEPIILSPVLDAEQATRATEDVPP